MTLVLQTPLVNIPTIKAFQSTFKQSGRKFLLYKDNKMYNLLKRRSLSQKSGPKFVEKFTKGDVLSKFAHPLTYCHTGKEQ